jgi:hypothetical protein
VTEYLLDDANESLHDSQDEEDGARDTDTAPSSPAGADEDL